ncbi:MAG: response regulator, partial [Saprospiraceae bacterium]
MEILLIDDNEGDRESVRRYLRQSSTTFTLTAVEDLAAGRAILENRDVTAILLDLGLAQTTGFQTINAFKDVFTTYPTIILTNNGNHVIGVQAVTLGAQDVLIKDKINPATLVQSIRFAVLRFEHYRTLQGMVGESKQLNQRLREVQRVAELASWSMDPLSYNMKWSEELFNLVGEKPHSFSPSRRDYLSYVPTDERDEVERFFTDALESIAPIELRHTVLVKNHQRIRVRVRAGAQFDPGANQIVLIGSVQQVKAAAISSLQRKQESTLKQRLLNLVIQGPRLDRPQLLQEIKALVDQEGRRESMAETLPA